MARTKKTATERLAEAGARAALEAGRQVELIDDGEEGELDADFEALNSLREIAGDSGVRFTVKRVKPYDKAGTLETISAEEIPELVQLLTDKYGPGTYTVHAKDAANRYVRGRHVTITIAPDARRQSEPAAPAAPPREAGGSHADIIREIEARNEQRRIEAREDRKEFRTLMVTLLSPVIPKAMELLLGRQPTLAEQVNMLGGLKSLAGGDSSEKTLELLKLGMDMAREQGGGAAPAGGGWAGAIQEGLRTVQGMIGAARPAALPAPAPPAAPKALPQPAAATPAAATTTESQNVTLTGPLKLAEPLLRKLAAELVEYEETETDPALAANALVAKIPFVYRQQVQPAQLIEWLNHPEWWQHAVSFHPALQGKHEYCDEVRAVLVQIFEAAMAAAKAES